jgi:hypothetical protein
MGFTPIRTIAPEAACVAGAFDALAKSAASSSVALSSTGQRRLLEHGQYAHCILE